MNNVKLLVGLGNPGRDYCNTRHNVGFWFIDKYLEINKVIEKYESRFNALVGCHLYKDSKIFIVKPQTYMNLSGDSVLNIKNYYKIDLDNIVVVHDELDFSPGIIKFKKGGGDNGHNGLKNITKLIGSNYLRLRCGIGKPEDRGKLINYVLSNPSLLEYSLIVESINHALKFMTNVFDGDLNTAMKQLHT